MMEKEIYSRRQECEILNGQLEAERTTFLADWRDIGDFILSSRPRFNTTDGNRGGRRNQKIIDSTATLAVRNLRAGMMSGITSPARRWFILKTPNNKLNNAPAVKQWLFEVSEIINSMFARSNLYNVLPVTYGDMGGFGLSPVLVEENFGEDREDALRFYGFAVGSYKIACDHMGRVNVFIRDFRMTVDQIVEKFARQEDGSIDWSIVSMHVKNLYDQKNRQAWVDVVHVIKPNELHDKSKLPSKYKKYASIYYEKGCQGKTDYKVEGPESEPCLSEKGYDYFPVLCPRWEVHPEDIYSTSYPGIDAIGDVKQLQHGEKKEMKAIDKMVDPPMTGPTSLRTSKSSILPGDMTYVDVREGSQGYRPAHEVSVRIQDLEYKQEQVRQRVRRAFYEDLFLMVSQIDRSDVTATEIIERREEKLMALGPVLEQLNQDLLDPLIDIAFQVGLRQELFPEPPDELKGANLKVEYISMMAQAQKALATSGIERFASFASQLVAIVPGAVHKVNTDAMLDAYAEAVSLTPNLVHTDEEANASRDAEMQMAQQQQQMQQAQAMAKGAKDLSQTDMSGDNALNRLINEGQAGNLTPQAGI